MDEPIPVTRDVDHGTAKLMPDVDRKRAWLLTVDGAPQSYVDLDEPAHLEFEYARRLGHVLDTVAVPGIPLDVLHLGGGALTLHFTAEYPGVSAAAPWYGQVKRAYPDAPGVDAFSLVDKIKAPVLGFYGEADTGIPVDDVKRFEAELKKKNPSVEFVLYPGAPHAFFSDDRPQVYKKEASDDAWKRCVAFFDKHLKA